LCVVASGAAGAQLNEGFCAAVQQQNTVAVNEQDVL